MKKLLKGIGIALLVIIALLIIIPIAFSDTIEKIVKEEINEATAMQVDYSDFSLSIFSSFPDLRAGLEGITVADSLGTDTMLNAQKVAVDVDLWGAIVNQSLKINKVEIVDANVAYVDTTDTLAAYVTDIDLILTGDLDANETNITLALDVANIQLWMSEIKYLDGLNVDFDAVVAADFNENKYTFKDNTLNLSGIPLAFDGWVQMVDTTFVLDMKLAALETSFKSVLALVPEYIMQDVEGLQADGTLELYANVNGTYINTDSLPTIDAALRINDGMIQYPDLPKSLNNINVDVTVTNPGASLDSTLVNVNKIHLELGDNPFDVDAYLSTPISNATFGANMVGTLDLNSLKEALPLDSMTIGGIVNADIHLATDMKTIEAEDYESITAQGTLALTDFTFTSTDFSEGISVPEAQLKLSPRYLDLNPLKVVIGSSDFSLTGKVENYLTYVLNDGTLKGTFTLDSKLIDANELMAMVSSDEETTEEAAAEAEGSAEAEETSSEDEGAVEVPKNINATFTVSIDSLIYDRLGIKNIAGAITVKDGIASLKNVGLNMCDGSVKLNGDYNTANIDKPFIDMDFAISSFDINELTNSFAVIDTMLPIAKSAYGTIDISLSLNTELDAEMSPVIKTMNGKGSFSSASIQLKGSDFQEKLCTLLNDDKYAEMTLKDCSTSFTIENGALVIDPFNIAMFGKTTTLSGSQGLDMSMDYKLSIPFSRSEITSLGSITSVISSEGDDLPVNVLIQGTVSKPSLSLDLSDATSQIANEAKAAVQEKVEEVKAEVTEKITEKLSENETVQEATESVKSAISNLLKK